MGTESTLAVITCGDKASDHMIRSLGFELDFGHHHLHLEGNVLSWKNKVMKEY